LTTLHLVGAKITDIYCARKGDVRYAFSLDVLMVPWSTIIVAIDGERLTCGGFSLGETVRLGNFDFNVDYFTGLSLSPRSGNSGTSFMGSPRSEASSPWQTVIEDSVEEFLMASSRDGGFGFPSPRRRGTWA
jgi:hypothetical protein